MKLLIDEMWPKAVAEQLRRRGHDVDAVSERPDLRSRSDEEIFAVAQAEGRAIVTDNVSDFRRIGAAAILHGDRHAGLIFPSKRMFSRDDRRTRGRLITALDALLTSGLDASDRELWLRAE